MPSRIIKKFKSHGTGVLRRSDFAKLGENVVFEPGVLVFHPCNIYIKDNVYIGHNTILKGYYKNKMSIGSGTWIGQQCFFHSAGGLVIGNNVGIGPAVKILTSYHKASDARKPVLHTPVSFAKVTIEDDSDIGMGVIILPGVTIGRGCVIGAGAVVNRSIPPYSVAVGNPAKIIKLRKKNK